jgi:ribosome-binding factor A
MGHRFSRRRRGPAPCASLQEGDGLDPRRPLPDDLASRPDRKTLQLCGQVARALAIAFEGLVADEALSGLHVESVAPAPDASCLRVAVRSPRAGADPAVLAVRLAAAHGFLRAEVTGAIRRRRAPELVFVVAAGPSGGGGAAS